MATATVSTALWLRGNRQSNAVGLGAYPAIAEALRAGNAAWLRVPGEHPGEEAMVDLAEVDVMARQTPAFCAAWEAERREDDRAGYELARPGCCIVLAGDEGAYFRAALNEYDAFTDRLVAHRQAGGGPGWAMLAHAVEDCELMVRLDRVAAVLYWPEPVCAARNAAAEAAKLTGDG